MKTGLRRWFVSLSLVSIFGLFTWSSGTAFAATPAAHSSLTRSSASPQTPVCTPGWEYFNVTNLGTTLHQIGPTYQYDNDTSQTVPYTFTLTTSATVSLSASISGSIDINAIIAGIKGQLGITVHGSVTISAGLKAGPINVPAGKSGFARFGIFVLETYGHYAYIDSNCKIGIDKGYITVHAPKSVGIETWTGAD